MRRRRELSEQEDIGPRESKSGSSYKTINFPTTFLFSLLRARPHSTFSNVIDSYYFTKLMQSCEEGR